MVAVLPTLFVIVIIIAVVLIIVNIVFLLSLPTCGAASGISCSFRNGVFWTNVAILILIILLGLIYYAMVRVKTTALYQCAYGRAPSVVVGAPVTSPLTSIETATSL